LNNATIAIIDYGAGNLRSVRNALTHLGAPVITASTPDHLADASKIVLPGVGAFGAGINALRAAGFEAPIYAAVEAGTPLLGICLGMQFLFETSDEMGIYQGLGLLPGRVTRFPSGDLKVPHMGWNCFEVQREHPLMAGISGGSYAYYVHSYYVEAADQGDVLATANYGIPFAAVVGRDNVFGIQPHPEKSQSIGLRILRNFVEM
jgi:imidazole glycerol-phosphate synthase subunit HisH